MLTSASPTGVGPSGSSARRQAGPRTASATAGRRHAAHSGGASSETGRTRPLSRHVSDGGVAAATIPARDPPAHPLEHHRPDRPDARVVRRDLYVALAEGAAGG